MSVKLTHHDVVRIIPRFPDTFEEFARLLSHLFQLRATPEFAFRYLDPEGDCVTVNSEEDFKIMKETCRHEVVLTFFEQHLQKPVPIVESPPIQDLPEDADILEILSKESDKPPSNQSDPPQDDVPSPREEPAPTPVDFQEPQDTRAEHQEVTPLDVTKSVNLDSQLDRTLPTDRFAERKSSQCSHNNEQQAMILFPCEEQPAKLLSPCKLPKRSEDLALDRETEEEDKTQSFKVGRIKRKWKNRLTSMRISRKPKAKIAADGEGYISAESKKIFTFLEAPTGSQQDAQTSPLRASEDDIMRVSTYQRRNSVWKKKDRLYIYPGVKCDRCGTVPIVGTWYRCSVCLDVNFCEECEPDIFHSHPFLKIDHPSKAPTLMFPKPVPSELDGVPFNGLLQKVFCKMSPEIEKELQMTSQTLQVIPSEVDKYCDKVYVMVQIGNPSRHVWPEDVALVRIGSVAPSDRVYVGALRPGEIKRLSIFVDTLKTPGRIDTYWRLMYKSCSGQFVQLGNDVPVIIEVKESRDYLVIDQVELKARQLQELFPDLEYMTLLQTVAENSHKELNQLADLILMRRAQNFGFH